MASRKQFDFTVPSQSICWTTSQLSPKALNEVPYIEMRGYRQDWGAVIGNISAWYSRAVDAAVGVNNPYEGLYLGTHISTYKLPYLEDYHHAISQQWGDGTGGFGTKTEEVMNLAMNFLKAALPGVGVVKPKSYTGSSEASYSFTLNLINTYEVGVGHKNKKRNREFLESIIMDSLHRQNNALSIEPPLIFEVFIPGIRWSPASVITNVSVTNKGSLNMAKDIGMLSSEAPKKYIFPDAWEVTITLTELIKESKNLYEQAITHESSIGNISVRAIKSASK